MMAAPPFEAGAVKAILACVLPAVAVTPVGAPGTTAFTVNDWLTVGAASQAVFPVCSALMVQVPLDTKVSTPPAVMLQTAVVLEVKLTARPELAVAPNVGVVPK